MNVLTERSTGRFDESGLTVTYPNDAFHAAPRRLRPDADVLAAYDTIVRNAVKQRAASLGQVVVEVSGGLDSANVAVSLARLADRPVASYGLIVGGAPGAQQRQRRTELINLLGLNDLTVDALDWLPLCPKGRRVAGEVFWPFDEPYSEAIGAALAQCTEAGKTIVYTGIGGDELMSLREFERSPRPVDMQPELGRLLTDHGRSLLDSQYPAAPAPVIPEPSLLAFACRSPVFLRAGVWPVSPLCAPEMVRFCEWLPVEWRRGRRLHRQRLTDAGIPSGWVEPALRENFAPVMAQAMTEHGRRLADALLPDSLLVQLGLVEPAAVAGRSGTEARAGVDCYEFLNVELGLRRLLRLAVPDGWVSEARSRLATP